MTDAIDYEILEDGTISIKTSKVSPQNHVSADQLLAEIHTLLGGSRQTRRRTDVHVNLLDHGHVHAHTADGHTH